MVHPDLPELGVVLAAVKHAARRLRRWPAAMPDRKLRATPQQNQVGAEKRSLPAEQRNFRGGQFLLSPRAQFLTSLDTSSRTAATMSCEVALR